MSSMLSLFPGSFLIECSDLRISLTDSYTRHSKVHTYFCAFTVEHFTKTVFYLIRSRAGNTEYMLACPNLLAFLLCELLSRCLTYRTSLRRSVAFMNITTYLTYPFHNKKSPFLRIALKCINTQITAVNSEYHKETEITLYFINI